MNIAVIGTGYVGLVTGTCLAHSGHQVTCIDIDEEKVKAMNAGNIPIYEPGLEDMFKQALEKKKLKITTGIKEGVKNTEVIFLALPTPSADDGSADLSAVLSVAKTLGPLLKNYTVIVNKSTVPVGTGTQVKEIITKNTKVGFDVVSNPEFLREGRAVGDFMHPDRIVIGTDSKKAEEVMCMVYESFITDSDQLVFMDLRSSEMTKYAANTFLAMKVSFMNEIANLCERVGANVDSIRLGIGPDKRIGSQFLRAGIGYGGSCFPKDIQALLYTSKKYDYNFRLLESIIDVNTTQKSQLVDKLLEYYDKDINGKHFAIWGLAFKPDTDDIREAPSLELIDKLLKAGATVAAYDPVAEDNTRLYFKGREGIWFADEAKDVLRDADALLVVTEWQEFYKLDFKFIRQSMKTPVVFDGRNIYKLDHMKQQQFHYESIGRPKVVATNN